MARLDKIKRKYGNDIPNLPGIPSDLRAAPDLIDKICTCLVAADPTPNNKYVEWLLKAWVNNTFAYEDIAEGKMSVVGTNCHDFEKLKGKLVTSDGSPDVLAMSLTKYKSPGELWSAIQHLLDEDTTSNKELKRQELERAKRQTHEVRLDDGSILRFPMTRFAAQFYGQSTRWCTSSKNNVSDLFSSYASSSPLCIIATPDGERYQSHFSGIRLELRDTADALVRFKTPKDVEKFSSILDYLCSRYVNSSFLTRATIRDDIINLSQPKVEGFFQTILYVSKIFSLELFSTTTSMFHKNHYLAGCLKSEIIKKYSVKEIKDKTPNFKKSDVLALLEEYARTVKLDSIQENTEADAVVQKIEQFIYKGFPDHLKIRRHPQFTKFATILHAIYLEDQKVEYIDMLVHLLSKVRSPELPKELSDAVWQYMVLDIRIERIQKIIKDMSMVKLETGLYEIIYKRLYNKDLLPELTKYKETRGVFFNSEVFAYLMSKGSNSYFLRYHDNQHPLGFEELKSQLWDAYVNSAHLRVESSIDTYHSLSKETQIEITTNKDFLGRDYQKFVEAFRKYNTSTSKTEEIIKLLRYSGVSFSFCNITNSFSESYIDFDILDAMGQDNVILLLIDDSRAGLYYMEKIRLGKQTRTVADAEKEKKKKKRKRIQAIKNVRKMMKLSKADIKASLDHIETITDDHNKSAPDAPDETELFPLEARDKFMKTFIQKVQMSDELISYIDEHVSKELAEDYRRAAGKR